MKRAKIRYYLEQVVDEYRKKPYAFWQTVTFPIVFERLLDSQRITFEIHALESTPEYFHIGFSAGTCGFSAYFPVGFGADIIIKKEKGTNNVDDIEVKI